MVLDEFFKAYSGSEIKVCLFAFGEVWVSPNVETFLFRRPSIQLSLGGLLSSRARFRFTGLKQFAFLATAVKPRVGLWCLEKPQLRSFAAKQNAL